MSKKRKLFDELMDGVEAMRKHRAGKITLRTHEGPFKRLQALDHRVA